MQSPWKPILPIGPALIYVSSPTYEHTPVFSIDTAAFQATIQLGNACKRYNVPLVAYVLMPSYLHALIATREKVDIAEFMYNYKWLSTRALIGIDLGEHALRLERYGRFRLWMRRFDHLIISTNEQFQNRLDYIHQAPVRAGLVQNPEDWAYSSAKSWIQDKSGLVPVEKDISWLNLL